jgi:hypothetical protein
LPQIEAGRELAAILPQEKSENFYRNFFDQMKTQFVKMNEARLCDFKIRACSNEFPDNKIIHGGFIEWH